jgi:hypothetical protein
MTRVDDEVVKDAEQHIKIFLSSVDRLDKSLHFAAAAGSGTASADNANDAGSGTGSHAKKEKSWWWFGFTNYMCLLNIPKLMRLFGPLVLYWEGAGMGEKYLQEVKYLINDGSHPGDDWLVSTLNTVFQWKVLKQLLMILESQTDEDNDDVIVDDDDVHNDSADKYQHFDSVCLLKSKEELDTAVASHFPLSAIGLVHGGEEMIVTGYKCGAHNIQWEHILFNNTGGGENMCGMWHAPITLHPIDMDNELRSKCEVKNTPSHCLVLLAQDSSEDEERNDNCYCALGNNWKERASCSNFDLPNVPLHLFQKLFDSW